MKKLFASFAPPEKWRDEAQGKWLKGEKWRSLRRGILERDSNACAYCGYRAEKYQIVDHIDGNPENNSGDNLQVICQMCNLVKHAGFGCVVEGVVDLYRKSRYNQNGVMRLTREMRDRGANDSRIINFLGLEEQAPFKMNREYLKCLYGFVTSRPSLQKGGMYERWLDYHKNQEQAKSFSGKQEMLAAYLEATR